MNKIYQEDGLETMKRWSEPVIDLTVTSPPYNCGIEYDVWDDNLPWDDYLSWCKDWLAELYRVTKPTGRLCLNVLLEMGIENNKRRVSPYAEMYQLFKEIGWKPFGSPVWVDHHRVKYTAWGSWLKSTAPYIYCPYEVVMIAYKDSWKRKSGGGTDISKDEFMMGCSGIWTLPTSRHKTIPATFHTSLPELCIKLLSNKGDVIYDPFMGSGTTAVAAIRLDRFFVGSEVSSAYCNIANERIKTIEKSLLKK